MTVPTTVRETLALDSCKGFRVLAGFGGLDREILTTTFIEAPDSWKWVRGGEFVLTLAYAFQQEDQLLGLVHELIEGGATCIGIKTSRYIKKVPQSVLDLADKSRFPIIDIPISVPFAEIIYPVQSLIINNQARLLRYSERVRHTFFSLSVRAAEIEEIISMLWEFTRLNMAFVDLQTGEKYLAPVTANPLASIDTKQLHGVLQNYPCESVSLNGSVQGYIVFDAPVEKIKDEWCEIPINQAKETLLLYFQRRIAQQQVESRYRNEFVQDLITHNIRMEQEARNRARIFNWNLEGPQQVIVVDIDNYKSALTRSISSGQGSAKVEGIKARIYTIAVNYLGRLGGGRYPYAEMSDSIVFIFPADEKKRESRLGDLLRRVLPEMMKAIHDETGFTVTVGVGDPCSTIFELSQSYKQAQQGLELLRSHTGGNAVAHWSEMGVYKLLYSVVDTGEGRRFVSRYLEAVLSDGRSSESLLETLEAIVACNWNLKEAAKILNVHYNTLKYRWKKICEMLNIDLGKSSDRFDVMLALKLYDMHRSVSKIDNLSSLGKLH